MIRVLLVEDDDIVAKVIQYYLGQEGGYEVVRTRNAGEALYAARDAFDVILLDILLVRPAAGNPRLSDPVYQLFGRQ